MTTFLMVRHGQHIRHAGDPSLTDVGRRQAQITAQHLTKLNIDAVHSSPLARARETALIIADTIGLGLLEDERLRERANYGDLAGQTFEEFVTMWQRCDRDRSHVPVLGLSAWANGARMEEWCRERHEKDPMAVIVACTHGGTISDFLLNVVPQELQYRQRISTHPEIGNCSITVITFDGHHFKLDEFASVDHLQ
jgi:broad specificity phosphatase PhoE